MKTNNQESSDDSESSNQPKQYTRTNATRRAGIKRTKKFWKFIIAIIIAALGTLLGAVLINWIQSIKSMS